MRSGWLYEIEEMKKEMERRDWRVRYWSQEELRKFERENVS